MPKNKSKQNYKGNKVLTTFSRLEDLLYRRARLASFVGGLVVVALWTVYRHISNGINFDVVGQIGLAQQWANGMMGGSQIGITNYVLKMPIYFATNGLGLFSPMGRLLFLALLFNLVTFALLFVIYEKIIKLYKIRKLDWFYFAFFWLATIAGDVFWVDYANSRNLEIVGGLLIVYLWLKLASKRTWQLLVYLLIVSSIAFFADSLMFYVIGLGLVVYSIIRLVKNRGKEQIVLAISTTTVVAFSYLLTKLMFVSVEKYYKVTFYSAPFNSSVISFNYFLKTLEALARNTLDIFGANFLEHPYSLNSIRQLFNAFVLFSIIVLFIKLRGEISKKLATKLAIVLIAINYLVYVLSGQVQAWATSRYLILVPVLTILIIGVVGNDINKKLARRLKRAWLIILAVNVVFIFGGLAMHWNSRHSKDSHILSVINFMQTQHYSYAISDRETGISASYISDGGISVLPFGCSNGIISPTNLFYDNASFIEFKKYVGEVPIILPGGVIKFGDNSCTKANIIAQFGEPVREQNIAGVGTTLIYSSEALHIKEIDQMSGYTSSDSAAVIAKIAKKSTLNKLDNCNGGTTDIIVAHADDDLLFINPDVQNKLSNKWCIRTVYLTAADDGREKGYWEKRENGIKAAYSKMLDTNEKWVDSETSIDGYQVITSRLKDTPSLSLMFMRLPDGGVNGKGFHHTNYSSLYNMSKNKDLVTTTVDGKSQYIYQSIVKVIGAIINFDQPTDILTTISTGQQSIGDHSDHVAVGQLAKLAAFESKSEAFIISYVGYPSSRLPSNLTSVEADKKKEIFSNYALNDEAICEHERHCSIDETYGNYFSRKYSFEQRKNNKLSITKKQEKSQLEKAVSTSFWLANLTKKTPNFQ